MESPAFAEIFLIIRYNLFRHAGIDFLPNRLQYAENMSFLVLWRMAELKSSAV